MFAPTMDEAFEEELALLEGGEPLDPAELRSWGQHLRGLRQAAGLTIEALAEKMQRLDSG